MLNFSLHTVSLATVAVLTVTVSIAAFSEPANPKDLATYVCKDVMRLSGEDRVVAMVLVHGYMLGKQNVTMFDTDKMARTSDNFIEYCLDHPAENALAAFEHAGKAK